MQLLPKLHFAFLNGWLFLVIYFFGLAITVSTYSKEKRKKLFYEPSYPKEDPRRIVITLGRIAAVSFVVLMFFTPLRLGTLYFYVGLLIYMVGFAMVMISLLEYKIARTEGLVTGSLYRISRNPQWVGLVLVFAGTSIAVASWLPVVLMTLLVVAYHFQILLEEEACLGFYRETYETYMKDVPRYLGF